MFCDRVFAPVELLSTRFPEHAPSDAPVRSAILKAGTLLSQGRSLAMQTPNEIAAAILVQTLVEHHPQLQAEIREDQPDPKTLASVLVPYYRAVLEELNSRSV
jgi:hypothetical protein